MEEILEEGELGDTEFESELDKVASSRGKLRRKLEADDPEFAKAFSEQTEAQKAWGKLLGKLILSRSNDDVENAFTWFEVEHLEGKTLPNVDRMVAFFHAIGSLGCDDSHYRILRRMYIRANTND
jgi:hypothetical protein